MAAKTLIDYTDDELNSLAVQNGGNGYVHVKAIRRAFFIDYASKMPHDPRLDAWAARMAARYGSRVGLHFHGRDHMTSLFESHSGLPWLAALLVVRYGEAPYVQQRSEEDPIGQRVFFYPKEWTDDDVVSASKWEAGKMPEGGFYFPQEAAS